MWDDGVLDPRMWEVGCGGRGMQNVETGISDGMWDGGHGNMVMEMWQEGWGEMWEVGGWEVRQATSRRGICNMGRRTWDVGAEIRHLHKRNHHNFRRLWLPIDVADLFAWKTMEG